MYCSKIKMYTGISIKVFEIICLRFTSLCNILIDCANLCRDYFSCIARRYILNKNWMEGLGTILCKDAKMFQGYMWTCAGCKPCSALPKIGH